MLCRQTEKEHDVCGTLKTLTDLDFARLTF